jgi:hypothetical protein
MGHGAWGMDQGAQGVREAGAWRTQSQALHRGRCCFSCRASVVLGFAQQQRAVTFAAYGAEERCAWPGLTLWLGVGLPPTDAQGRRLGGAAGAGAAAAGPDCQRLTLVFDFERHLLPVPAPQLPAATPEARAALQRSQAPPSSPAVPMAPPQRLGLQRPQPPQPPASAPAAPTTAPQELRLPQPPARGGAPTVPTGAVAAREAAVQRMVRHMSPLLEALPWEPKQHAYQAWLVGQRCRRKQLGWSNAQLVAAAAQYARVIGCKQLPALPRELAARLGLLHVPGILVKNELEEWLF